MTLLLARVALAGVFGVAGATKLSDRRGFRQALTDFGIAPRFAAVFAVVLPLAELTIAFALIATPSVWWAALGALVLLVLFIVAISFNLLRGRAPECRCFGQIHSRPVSWPIVLRNIGLTFPAALLVWQEPTGAAPSMITDGLGAVTAGQLASNLLSITIIAVVVGEAWDPLGTAQAKWSLTASG